MNTNKSKKIFTHEWKLSYNLYKHKYFLFHVTSMNTSRSLGLRRLWLALGLFTSQKEENTSAEDKGNGGFDNDNNSVELL